nr:glycoside hydrolase family 28 protein [Treponema sp.]
MQSVILKDFGGMPSEFGTNIFDNSTAFYNAINVLKQSGGGVLTVTKGTWYTGPIELFSNITLNLEKGAEISFLTDEERYLPVYTRWEGVDCFAMHPCIFANDQKNVIITGKGTINGNGQVWWKKRLANKKQQAPVTEIQCKFAKLNPGYEEQPSGGGGRNIQFLRPPLIQFYKCTDCAIEDVKVKNS